MKQKYKQPRRGLIAFLSAFLCSSVAFAQIPVVDPASASFGIKDIIADLQQQKSVVDNVMANNKTLSAIGDAKKSVSEFAKDKMEKLEKAKKQYEEYKKRVEDVKAQAEAYKELAESKVAEAQALKDSTMDKINEAQSLAQNAGGIAQGMAGNALGGLEGQLGGMKDLAGGALDSATGAVNSAAGSIGGGTSSGSGGFSAEERTALEQEVASYRSEISSLREEINALREQLNMPAKQYSEMPVSVLSGMGGYGEGQSFASGGSVSVPVGTIGGGRASFSSAPTSLNSGDYMANSLDVGTSQPEAVGMPRRAAFSSAAEPIAKGLDNFSGAAANVDDEYILGTEESLLEGDSLQNVDASVDDEYILEAEESLLEGDSLQNVDASANGLENLPQAVLDEKEGVTKERQAFRRPQAVNGVTVKNDNIKDEASLIGDDLGDAQLVAARAETAIEKNDAKLRALPGNVMNIEKTKGLSEGLKTAPNKAVVLEKANAVSAAEKKIDIKKLNSGTPKAIMNKREKFNVQKLEKQSSFYPSSYKISGTEQLSFAQVGGVKTGSTENNTFILCDEFVAFCGIDAEDVLEDSTLYDKCAEEVMDFVTKKTQKSEDVALGEKILANCNKQFFAAHMSKSLEKGNAKNDKPQTIDAAPTGQIRDDDTVINELLKEVARNLNTLDDIAASRMVIDMHKIYMAALFKKKSLAVAKGEDEEDGEENDG